MKGNNGSAGASSKRWRYAATGALGGLVGGLLVAAFTLLLPGGETNAGSESSVEQAAAASAPDTSAADSQQGSFPGQYDTLGVAIGPEDAPVVVREFADYQCPYCARFADVVGRIREEYVESGKVRFIFFDLPITSIHPNAMAAAQTARCAGRQNAYWEMHDQLFSNQSEWKDAPDPLPRFRAYARRIEIDPAKLARCVESRETEATVRRNMEFARALGIQSTPTLVIGNRGYAGNRPWSDVRSLIERALGNR